MKRRNFLLSLPLIGMAAKALAKPEEVKPPDWAKNFAQVKTGEHGKVLTWNGEYPEWKDYPHMMDGKLHVKSDSHLAKWLSQHPGNASNCSEPIFFKKS
jgi:hypothetical protein